MTRRVVVVLFLHIDTGFLVCRAQICEQRTCTSPAGRRNGGMHQNPLLSTPGSLRSSASVQVLKIQKFKNKSWSNMRFWHP